MQVRIKVMLWVPGYPCSDAWGVSCQDSMQWLDGWGPPVYSVKNVLHDKAPPMRLKQVQEDAPVGTFGTFRSNSCRSFLFVPNTAE